MPSPVGLPSAEPLSEVPLSEVLPSVPAVSAALLLPHSLPPALPVLLHLLPPVPAHLLLPALPQAAPDKPDPLLPGPDRTGLPLPVRIFYHT